MNHLQTLARATALLVALATHSLASAQNDAEQADIEPPRRYAVEVIVFTYEENVSVGTEVFVPEPLPEVEAFLDTGTEFGDAASGLGASDVEVAPDPEEFVDIPPIDLRLLNDEESTVGDILRKFELLDVYETLLHVGWSQVVHEEDQTLPIDISSLGRAPAELDGSLKLYLNRFLHLVVDLKLTAKGSAAAGISPVSIAVDRDPSFPGSRRTAMATGPVRYHISEDRIFKNGELRYFDHPKFGVLAKITRIEEPEVAAPTGELITQ